MWATLDPFYILPPQAKFSIFTYPFYLYKILSKFIPLQLILIHNMNAPLAYIFRLNKGDGWVHQIITHLVLGCAFLPHALHRVVHCITRPSSAVRLGRPPTRPSEATASGTLTSIRRDRRRCRLHRRPRRGRRRGRLGGQVVCERVARQTVDFCASLIYLIMIKTRLYHLKRTVALII